MFRKACVQPVPLDSSYYQHQKLQITKSTQNDTRRKLSRPSFYILLNIVKMVLLLFDETRLHWKQKLEEGEPSVFMLSFVLY